MMVEETVVVKLEIKTAALAKRLEHIIQATEGFCVQTSGDSEISDLLIYELEMNKDEEFHYIESLFRSGRAAGVFLIGESSNQEVLLQALRSGASEFLSQPLREDEVIQALKRFQEKRTTRLSKPAGRVVTVFGSKGGVGTSTIAVNLATCLAESQKGAGIALVDMNMLTGEIPIFLEINPGYHWGEIAQNSARLDATYLMNVMYRYDSNLHVLASPGTPGHLTVSPDIVERVFQLLRRSFRFVVVDGGTALEQLSTRALQMADQVFLVAILSLPCLANANKILSSFSYWGYPPQERIKIIINRYLKSSEISLEEAESTLQRRVFWTIPNDYRTTMGAVNQGKPLNVVAPRAAITGSFEKLGTTLAAGECHAEKNECGLFKKWFAAKGK